MALSAKWTATVDDGISNAAWDAFDNLIKSEVGGYNLKFAGSPGYAAVDWTLCKAQLWVESAGPDSPSWTKRVMQIGNPGDPALAVLTNKKEGSDLIMSVQLAAEVASKPIDQPELNVKAAIAYLFTRMAKFGEKTVGDAPGPGTVSTYTVVLGDNLWNIAKKIGTTVDVLKSMNRGADKAIHPKQVLKYQKATVQATISGWRVFTTAAIAERYNGGGDPDYSGKLDYVLDLFKKLKR